MVGKCVLSFLFILVLCGSCVSVRCFVYGLLMMLMSYVLLCCIIVLMCSMLLVE